MKVIKSILLFFAFVLIGGVLMIVSFIRWGDPKVNFYFLQSFGWAARKIVGIRQIRLHEEKIHSRRPAVLIANHQTGLDFAYLGSICPPNSVIVAKKEVQYIPLFGWFFKAAGNILIDRSKTKDAKRMINEVTQTLKARDLNLVIFPEGTRNRHGTELMLPFKKGAFHLAASTQLPIIPVVCSSLKGKAIWENFDLSGGTIVISVLDPVETKDVHSEDMDAFKDKVRALMLAELKRINILAEEYSRNPGF